MTADRRNSGKTIEPDDATPRYNPRLFRIGEVAEIVGLSLRTVRFYEEAGLVAPAKRTEGGFRLYDEDCIERFRIIMQMKPLGFTLEEMRSMIEMRSSLQSEGLNEESRKELIDRRQMFALIAQEKVRSLRKQLDIAEKFSADLTREAGEFGRSRNARS